MNDGEMTVKTTIPQPVDNVYPCPDTPMPVLSNDEKRQLKEKIISQISDIIYPEE